MASERPACSLQWWMLAGIGRVESNHGRYGGAQPGTHGDVAPRIVGIPLDGSTGVGTIPDSDHGVWDGDTQWDRAVGPRIVELMATVAADDDIDGKIELRHSGAEQPTMRLGRGKAVINLTLSM